MGNNRRSRWGNSSNKPAGEDRTLKPIKKADLEAVGFKFEFFFVVDSMGYSSPDCKGCYLTNKVIHGAFGDRGCQVDCSNIRIIGCTSEIGALEALKGAYLLTSAHE